MPRPAVIVAYSIPVVAMTYGVITFLRDASRKGRPSTDYFLFFGVVALLVGVIFVMQAVSKGSQKHHNAEVAHLQSVFGALAVETGLRLDAPPPYEHPMGVSHGIYPHVEGTYRGYVVSVGMDVTELVELALRVKPRAGDRWPKAKLVRRGNPPAWLSSTGREVVRRLLAPDRRPSRIDALQLSPTELRCVPWNVTGKVAQIEGMKMGALDPSDLRQILDDLILLVETLPS